jgi:hypothetical protein
LTKVDPTVVVEVAADAALQAGRGAMESAWYGAWRT